MFILHDTSHLPGGGNFTTSMEKFWSLINQIGRASVKAHEIATLVQNHDTVIKIACFDNRDGCFGGSCSEIGVQGPVILWDSSKSFLVRGREITGVRSFNKSNIYSSSFEELAYPPELVLLHEVGHALQYIEDPGRFNHEEAGGQVVEGTWTTKQIESDNLERHERPVAQQMGLKVRQNYEDYLGFS